MRSKLLAASASQATDNAALTAMCDALADAVITHLLAAAVVNVTVTVATTGTAAAQTGGGSGSGTIT
jgi:hypothetical protein